MSQPASSGGRERLLAQVGEQARAEAGGLPAALLGDVLPVLVDVATTGRRLRPDERELARSLGAAAAAAGVRLSSMVDLCLGAARLLWPYLPELAQGSGPFNPIAAGGFLLQAAADTLHAVADGFGVARRTAVRAEESARREFVDDLLGGQADVGRLVERAERFGLDLALPHAVAVLSPRDSAAAVRSGLERELPGLFGEREVLVTTKGADLVCVVPGGSGEGTIREHFRAAAARSVGKLGRGVWRIGVGRPRPGPGGVHESYREALEVVDLAERLGLPDRICSAEQLLVYRVLLRDRAAMADLVDAVVGPLEKARGGAGPLIDTLIAYFDAGAVAAETARRMHLSVRAVTYRLDRVRSLTGYDVSEPGDRLPLQVAALGARLLGRPAVASENRSVQRSGHRHRAEHQRRQRGDDDPQRRVGSAET